jgi:GxxExxY protein
MLRAGTATPVAADLRTQIFSEGDREIGSRASVNFGFTLGADHFHATQSVGDRFGSMKTAESWTLSEMVIGACIEVHRQLGPGLLESIYQECLCRELTERGLRFERQKPLTVVYKGAPLDQAYRVDLIVEGSLLVEIKALDGPLPIHAAQVVTYLRVAGLEHGLLVNFNAMTIRDGLRRLSRTPKNSRSPDLPAKKSGSV